MEPDNSTSFCLYELLKVR